MSLLFAFIAGVLISLFIMGPVLIAILRAVFYYKFRRSKSEEEW